MVGAFYKDGKDSFFGFGIIEDSGDVFKVFVIAVIGCYYVYGFCVMIVAFFF